VDRSANMRAIRAKNTHPEMIVRRLIHGMGYRYRLHKNDLPGKPDLVFASRRKVIFIHGCFWHFHGCERSHSPKTNTDYWLPKLKRNRERYVETEAALSDMGWSSLVIWECQTRNIASLSRVLKRFLSKHTLGEDNGISHAISRT